MIIFYKLILIFCILLTNGNCKIATLSLEQMVQDSDYIFMGVSKNEFILPGEYIFKDPGEISGISFKVKMNDFEIKEVYKGKKIPTNKLCSWFENRNTIPIENERTYIIFAKKFSNYLMLTHDYMGQIIIEDNKIIKHYMYLEQSEIENLDLLKKNIVNLSKRNKNITSSQNKFSSSVISNPCNGSRT